MTKGCILLRADTHRLCKWSVTDRSYCEMFRIPVWEVREAPRNPQKWSSTWSMVGYYVIDLLSNATCHRQTFSEPLKKVAIS